MDKPKPPNAGKGRKKGVPNKVTAEIREVTQRLFDPTYWAYTRKRLVTGKLPPAVETKLLAYAFGEPTQTVDMPQVGELVALLSRKVVHELHPGPTLHVQPPRALSATRDIA